MKEQFKFSIGDKVFVSDWGKHYSTKFKYVDSIKTPVFNWNIEFPDFYDNDTSFHISREYTPKLTLKGQPFKDGSKILVSETHDYKNYEYEIIDRIIYNDSIIYLLMSEKRCIVQIGEKGLSTLTIKEQEELKVVSHNNYIKALAKDNLSKWSITDDLSKFPSELIKVLYDTGQKVLFGSSYTKGIVTYQYIDKMFTIKNRDILISTSVDYNGEGCSLEGKETITFSQAKERFNYGN